MHVAAVNIGTAGWSIPTSASDQFAPSGSSLERYGTRFNVAEVNSSFHRSHRISTWQRWKDSSPPGFRFSVKLPRLITHQLKLVGYSAALHDFLVQAETLGEKLGVLLVQLPPRLTFDEGIAATFFADLVGRTPVPIACEPRHQSWFETKSEHFLRSCGVARVAADPSLCTTAATPGGSTAFTYWRLHGSPHMYRSSYADRIEVLAERFAKAARVAETWCIFDNTTSSAAIPDAIALQNALSRL